VRKKKNKTQMDKNLNISFPCSSCGLCCKKISTVAESLRVIGYEFPYKWDENGTCEKLIDNKCSVYDNRPYICSVDKMHEFVGGDKKEFYNLNVVVCNTLMDENNAPQELRIELIQ